MSADSIDLLEHAAQTVEAMGHLRKATEHVLTAVTHNSVLVEQHRSIADEFDKIGEVWQTDTNEALARIKTVATSLCEVLDLAKRIHFDSLKSAEQTQLALIVMAKLLTKQLARKTPALSP